MDDGDNDGRGQKGGNGDNQRGRLMDDGKRDKDHYLLAFQKCIVGSAHTYMVQEGEWNRNKEGWYHK
jgi:hypothetical protein